MSTPSRSPRAAALAAAILLAVPAASHAQRASADRGADRFIRTKNHVFNPSAIKRIEFGVAPEAAGVAFVYFVGELNPLQIDGEDAEGLRDAFGAPSPGSARRRVAVGGSRLAAFDDFDGKPALNWKPVRPDPSHVSFAKVPGTLTITTQRGSIHGDEKKDEYGEGIQAKNLYLIDNPLAEGADFVATTCVSGLTPVAPYQQAGLIVYDDDDNYLKLDYEFNWGKGEGQTFFCVSETAANPQHHPIEGSESGLKRYWLRLTKRGDRYEYATSLDGKEFRVHGEVAWGGDASPKRIGLLAKNGGNKDAPEADASFEFFELRSPASPRDDPAQGLNLRALVGAAHRRCLTVVGARPARNPSTAGRGGTSRSKLIGAGARSSLRRPAALWPPGNFDR